MGCLENYALLYIPAIHGMCDSIISKLEQWPQCIALPTAMGIIQFVDALKRYM